MIQTVRVIPDEMTVAASRAVCSGESRRKL